MNKTALQKIRISKGLSQSQLANRSGVNLRTLQDFDQGRKSLINAKGEMLYRISMALDCSIYELLSDNISEIEFEQSSVRNNLERFFLYNNFILSHPLYNKYYTFPVIVPNTAVDMKRVYPTKQSLIYNLHEQLSSDKRIAAIMLFGSSITMQCNKDSDTDLAVRLNTDFTNDESKNSISEKIQEICNWNADIIWYDRISPSDRIYHDICKGVQIV